MDNYSFYNKRKSKMKLLNKLSIVLIALTLAIFIYFSLSSVLMFVDNNFLSISYSTIREYEYALRAFIAAVLAGVFVYSFYKRNDFIVFGRNWLIIYSSSFLLSGILHIILGNSILWPLKYVFLVIFIGTISYLFNWKNREVYTGLLTGIISLLASFFGGELEYFLTMDPSIYPSIFYVRSFPNFILWFCLLLFLFLSTYFLSTGFLIKNFIKRGND